ncbi:CAAX prenyl protease-like protein [Larkinella arboricola]|uniref:CAAX prenyl protease-like protein n=1 Tax=Larkinella arboricola TaxID=643671 RepID=A0A327WFW4_LARAB|nr:type II CAAX endopeptidase family protein [Larkinella arboricola]RAJ89676.1 CAAX prenyl protease-like protein [Larkinella arboricola]
MKKIIGFFLTAYGFSWICWSPYLMPGFPESWQYSAFLHYLGLTGPLLAAGLWTYIENDQAGLQRLARSLLVPRGPAFYWLVVPIIPFLLLGFATGVISSGELLAIDWSGLWRSRELSSIHPAAFILLNVFVVGFGEEAGWRGFALPHLQQRYPAWAASLLITAGWALWHWPLFFYQRSGYYTMDMGGISGWLVSLVTGSFLFTWLFNSSRGSVLACALFHASMDITFMADLGEPRLMNTIGMVITAWGLGLLILYNPRRLSRYQQVLGL